MEEDAFLRPKDQADVELQDLHTPTPSMSKPVPSTTLMRSTYILWIVAFYAALAVLSWAVICILTFRPLAGTRYGYMTNAYMEWKHIRNPANLATNGRWYQAMRVIQSIVGVLTIPITSAVCSSAAAAYAQYIRRSPRLSMRQMMILADRGWTDPKTMIGMLSSWARLKRNFSSFLVLAILLNLLGGVIQPVQQVFLTQTTVKTPAYRQMLYRLLDITDQPRYAPDADDGSVVLMTREALSTTSVIEPMIQLWQGAGFSCAAEALRGNATDSYKEPPAACGY